MCEIWPVYESTTFLMCGESINYNTTWIKSMLYIKILADHNYCLFKQMLQFFNRKMTNHTLQHNNMAYK